MSGLFLSERPHGITPQPSGSDLSSAMDDPAASLRAAALLTLKSNRRKANTGNEVPVGLLPRPVSTAASIQLDYGTEEPSFGASSTASSTTTSAAIPRPAPAPEPMEVDEVREEGEISDSESTPGHKSPPQQPASPRATPPNPRSRHQPLPPKLSLNESSAASSAIKLPTTAPIAVKTEPAPAALDQSVGPTSATISAASHRSVSYPNEAMLVDEEHVRPGLSMTQAQYNTAKDIVLDLLGWGVPPEYLVSCGLSREIVYYVFIELNLRLPNNLDVTGLPESTAVFGSPEPMSPPSHLNQRSDSGVGHATTPPRPVHAHPSLPRKPPAPRRTSANAPAEGPASQLSATAPLFVPSASTSIPISGEQPSLFDMEQQRRQELLARKAVLASRKLKNAAAASSSYAPANEAKDVDMAPPIVPTKTVEDFLNSIPAVSTDSKSPGGDDDMDVDAIPGLSANRESPQSNASTPRSTSVSDIITTSEIVPPPRTESGSPEGSTRNSKERSVDGGSALLDDKSDTSSGQHSGLHSAGSRRATKRPVAADFVDMDPGASRSQGYGYGATYYQSNAPRKKPQSFAGLTGTRRMVINLSDSEDEVEDTVNGYGDHRSTYRSQAHYSRPPSRLGTSNSVDSLGSRNGIVSPAILLEKEQEIRRMRELIAKRERARLGKLTTSSNMSTPPPSVSDNSVMNTPVSVKQEEDEGIASASLRLPRLETREATVVPILASALARPSESNSDPTTPIDVASNTMEHTTTGDKVLTIEARQEYVPRMPSPVEHFGSTPEAVDHRLADMEVDVLRSLVEASSTQHTDAQPEVSKRFTAYHSTLFSYPLLRSFLRSSSFYADCPAYNERNPPASSSGPDISYHLDLRLLKAATFDKWLSDPSKQICRYEIPGGGECRDHACEDIHISRALVVEPSDDETAQYLRDALPHSSPITLKQLEVALQDAHRRQATASFDARVAEALASLGLRTAT